MAVYEEGLVPSSGGSRTSIYVNYAGAALSLALIVGVSVWGYKLIMRDVSGIPVVRAMEGDMRVLPDNPGGDVALHTGLAVNEVAAIGEAGGPEDRLVLAPATVGLAQEDLDVQPLAEADEVLPQATPEVTQVALNDATAVQPDATPLTSDDATPLNSDDVLALADQIAESVQPLEAVTPAVEIIATTVPGVASSLRPAIRPASLRVAVPAAATATAVETPVATTGAELAVSTEEFAAGTNLVQLGAFPSPTLAGTQWDSLQARFGKLMGNHTRVIQVSNQSSGTWYRLRASGFADRADARRFCAALAAEGADCVAITVN